MFGKELIYKSNESITCGRVREYAISHRCESLMAQLRSRVGATLRRRACCSAWNIANRVPLLQWQALACGGSPELVDAHHLVIRMNEPYVLESLCTDPFWRLDEDL